VSFSPDGSLLASGDDDGRVLLWKTASCVRFSHDGLKLAASDSGGGVRIYRAEDHKEVLVIEQEISQGFVEWSPSGQFLVTGTDEYFTHGDLKLWNAITGKLALALPRRTVTRHAIFSPTGGEVISTRLGQSFEVFNVMSGRSLFIQTGLGQQPQHLDVSRDGETLVVATHDDVQIWDLRNRRRTARFGGHKDFVVDVKLSPNGRVVASGSWDGTIRIWSLESKKLLATLGDGQTEIESIDFSPDGSVIASAGSSSSLLVWPIDALPNDTPE
jgi:WD40 repeat protein